MDNSDKKGLNKPSAPVETNPEVQSFEAMLSRDLSREEIPSVSEAKGKLDNLIEDLNDKLVNHFKMKEEALLNQYKQELVEQQRMLNELKNHTNEEQIRQKMLERKAELEKERNHLIQTNMFFSQKCEQYKQVYSKLVQESHDLDREIKFLDNQIEAASNKRLALIDEVGPCERESSHLPVFTDKKKMALETERKENSTLDKTKKSSSLKKIGKSLQVSEKKPLKSSSIKNFQKYDKGAFEKSILEKLFEESVEEVKNRRKSKRTMPSLKGEEFTEYEKRAIMEIFLGNEEVKKKIYEIIFNDSDKPQKSGIKGMTNEKVKISFDELGI